MRALRLEVRLLSLFFWFFLFQGDGKALAPQFFALLHPSDRSVWIGAGLADLVLEAEPSVKISVRLNGKPVEGPKVAKRIYHYPLRLELGLNRIEVEAARGERLLRQEKRELFFFSQIAKEKEIPPGFAPRPFHSDAKSEERCGGCHVLEPKKSDFSPPAPKDSSCHACHKRLVQFKQVHGPASLWNCLVCHDAKSTPARYSTPVPVRDLCYGCHKEQRDYFFSSQYQHGPTATGMCTICHNPHASDNEYWLKKEPWDLCTTCHFEKASGRHVLAWGPTGDTHPTRGRPDPMKPDREFSCRSCHNPHASNAPKLWNFNATTAYELCWTCHRK